MSPVSWAGQVCRDNFQPGLSSNDSSTNDLDHLFPAIWWLIFCTYAAGWVTKLSEGCVSEWGQVPSGVSQGTKLGPWLFLIVINDLAGNNALLWKYVDDITASEGDQSNAQAIADTVADWSP